ncbi:putative aldouronate transport system substrate-binding protein [Paenibacillus sp. UNCCL117]|uniref:extracellular solute-binding protein n=1 Tax=unclassified Paenibacillus TaxID=185978 RepID=UPI000881F774|nr:MULTISPECIES: extracellular solute-binding protein [unclassified Paenibacillus]SDE40940.1 putative aldouronate transport system substrate-binding protein [Paenibacillus sp. cl123]SFW65413.1 putative aldouronate transport system substrate-binding protein [Paenibacillus sp. UNCCL117]
MRSRTTFTGMMLFFSLMLAISALTSCSSPSGNGVAAEPEPGGIALSYWAELNGNAGSVRPTFQEVPFFQEWQKRTGVQLKFIQPPSNQAKEALNVLLASGELPDLIEFEWSQFPGGPVKAVKDGYIIRLNDLIDNHAPNLKKYLSQHPEIDRQVKTDDGSYYVFPFIRGDDLLRTYQGPIIRKDWLNELNLQTPETIDEWYTVLKAFKEKKGAEAPLTFLGVPHALFGIEGGGFVGAFGIKKGFYMDRGRVKFGAMEEGYKQFLTTFRQWYEEGLIDRNIATVDTKTMDSNMIMGRSGATLWNAGAGIGKWQPLVQEKDPGALFEPAPYPVLNKGERPKFGQRSYAYEGTGGVAISSKSKHPEEAARLLDYGYGPEGHMLFNFGVEGVSYTLENGYPKYTDLILRNPDKLAPAQAIAMYSRASYFGPFVQDVRYLEQFYTLPQQRRAAKLWADTEADQHMLPQLPKTELESAEFSAIMNDVTTLVDEMSLKLILGVEPMSAFDGFVSQLKALRIERAIEIQEQALARARRR